MVYQLQRGAKKISSCLKFPPHFCPAKWPAHAQPIGPDGTCVTQLSSLNFARLCSRLAGRAQGRGTDTSVEQISEDSLQKLLYNQFGGVVQ